MRNERTAQDKMWDTEPEKPVNQKLAVQDIQTKK